MSTTTKTRQSRDLFASRISDSSKPNKGGKITVEWSGEGDLNYIPVDLIDTVHITTATGNRSTYEFAPGDSRALMLLDACDVAWHKGNIYGRSNALAS